MDHYTVPPVIYTECLKFGHCTIKKKYVVLSTKAALRHRNTTHIFSTLQKQTSSENKVNG